MDSPTSENTENKYYSPTKSNIYWMLLIPTDFNRLKLWHKIQLSVSMRSSW